MQKMNARLNFLDADNSFMDNNRRFSKSDLEDNLNKYFSGSVGNSRRKDAETGATPPREYQVVQPSRGRYNATRESRDNTQWQAFTSKVGNTAFEMTKNSPSRIPTTPPPPSIEWKDVVGRFSTGPILEGNKDSHGNFKPVCNGNQPNRDIDNVRHNFNQNTLRSETADECNIRMDDGQHRNIRSLHLEKASEGFWRLDSDERHCDSPKVVISGQKEGFWKSESAFQNKVQPNFKQTQGCGTTKIDFDLDRNGFDKSIHQIFQDRDFSNTNNPQYKNKGGFWSLKTANDNNCGNDNGNNKCWKPFATGDIRENNQSKKRKISRADDMNFDITTENHLDSNTFKGDNFDEERFEVRIPINAKVQCVSMTTKQYERYKKALSLGFTTSEALDFSAKGLQKIGIVPTNLKQNPLSLHQMQQIENTIIQYAVKWSFNTNLISSYPQNGWLIMLCNVEIVNMIQSHLTVIRNICRLNINLVMEGDRLFPTGHIVQGFFPRSITYSTDKVMELIQAQNDIKTTLWRSMRPNVEKGLVLTLTFEVDDNSWRKLQELNGLIFYRFGQITLAMEESESNENIKGISQLSTTTSYTTNSKEISNHNVHNKPAIAPQSIQNATLLKVEQLKEDIATNMKLMKHKQMLEEDAINEHRNRIYQLATVAAETNTPREISEPKGYQQPRIALESAQYNQNAKLTKLNQLKKNIANNMKLLECNPNAKLGVVPESSPRHPVFVWIPPPVLETEKILKLLGKQNDGFNTHLWELTSTVPIDKSSGVGFGFSIDTESLKKMKNCRGKLKFGFGTVKFRFPTIFQRK